MAVRKQAFDDEGTHSDNPKKRSRITFDVTPELRRKIKVAAAKNDISIGEYIGGILEQIVPNGPEVKERPGITREAIERLQRTRKEIMEERHGRPFTEDSTEMLRQEREKRSRYLMGEDVYE